MGSLIDRAPQVRRLIGIIWAVTVQRPLKRQRERSKGTFFFFAALCVVIMLRFILIHNRHSKHHLSNMSCTDLLCHYHKGGHWAIMLGNCLTADVHLSANFLPSWSALFITLLHTKGTAAGAMSPNLCKVGTFPFTAAVRRPVCTYMPQDGRKTRD